MAGAVPSKFTFCKMAATVPRSKTAGTVPSKFTFCKMARTVPRSKMNGTVPSKFTFLQNGRDSTKAQNGRNTIKVYAYAKWLGQCGQSAVRAYERATEQTVLSEFVRASRSRTLLRAHVGQPACCTGKRLHRKAVGQPACCTGKHLHRKALTGRKTRRM